MSNKKYLAIDLGASSGRGIVGEYDGGRLTLRENCRFQNQPVRLVDRLYWDILRIFHEIKQSIHRTSLDDDKISSLGIDTWGVDYALLDSHGHMMSSPVHYRDARNADIETYVWDRMPFERIYGVSGIQSLSFNTLYQLCAETREDAHRLERADRLLFIPDLLNYFLTGRMASEYTIMSTGALLDARTRELSDELLGGLGIPRSLFPKTVHPGNRLGRLLPELREELGVDTTVVNVASHDTASAVISVPNTSGDMLYISSGTWSLMGTELRAPIINDASRRSNFTNEGGADGTIRFLKNIMGLWILQESRRQWAREGREYSFAELETQAREAGMFAAFIDPDAPEFGTPGNMLARVADYCRRTGQHVPGSVGETVRCIYESLALKYRYVASGVMELTGVRPGAINIVGGGSKDGLLNRMTADACGLDVVAGPGEATAIGNLVVQMMSDGELGSINEGRELVLRSFGPTLVQPHDTAVWDAAYERFLGITGLASKVTAARAASTDTAGEGQ